MVVVVVVIDDGEVVEWSFRAGVGVRVETFSNPLPLRRDSRSRPPLLLLHVVVNSPLSRGLCWSASPLLPPKEVEEEEEEEDGGGARRCALVLASSVTEEKVVVGVPLIGRVGGSETPAVFSIFFALVLGLGFLLSPLLLVGLARGYPGLANLPSLSFPFTRATKASFFPYEVLVGTLQSPSL